MAERMVMPCVPLRGLSVFPHTILHFDIGREKSVKALEAAMTADKQLFLTSQKDENILIPTPEDYYAVGTVVKIKQMLKIQGDAVRVLVEGQYRAVMSGIATEEPYIMAEITEAEIVPADPQEIEVQALMRSVLYAFDDYMELYYDQRMQAMLPSQMENLHWNSPYHEGFEKTLADKTVRNWIGLIPRAFDDWFFGEYEKKLENMILLLEGRYGKSEHGDDGASGQ